MSFMDWARRGEGQAPRPVRRRRSFLELPSILLIASWIGIWFIWPTGKAATDAPQRRAGHTVFTYRGVVPDGGVAPEYPLSFFRAVVTGMVAGGSDPGADTPSMASVRRPAFLEASASQPVGRGAEFQAAGGTDAAQLGAYRPAWEDRPVFPARPAGVMRVACELSGSLRRAGFKVPDVLPENIRPAEVAWQAVLYVSCGPDGKPQSVFLESATPDKELNAVLVRTLYQGSAAPTGAAADGRVTISYGRE